jgi:hypothetical protein
MSRTSLFAAVLGATALVAVVASDARATESAVASASSEAATTSESASEQTSAVVGSSSSDQTPASADSVSGGTGSQSTDQPATAAPSEPVTAPATGSTGSSPASPGTPAVQPESPPSSSVSPPASQPTVPAVVEPSGTPPESRVITSVAPPAPEATAPAPSAGVDTATSTSSPSSTLGRLLPGVERHLRDVQTQIEGMERRLAAGVTPASKSLDRLRRSLEEIAPALLAIEASVGAGVRLTPKLRRLLHRVGTRLGDTRASAAELAAALRSSGLSGPEVQLLLRELEDFRALDPSFLPEASTWRPAAPEPVAPVSQSHVPAAPAPSAHGPARPETEAAVSRASASPGAASSTEVAPTTAASGSASAGPGGAVTAAGMAALAALLCAVALPRLLSRVYVAPVRRYAATYLVVLERPG